MIVEKIAEKLNPSPVLTELAAYAFLLVKPSGAQIYGSFLSSLPGVAGAYGGSLMRRALDNLRQGA